MRRERSFLKGTGVFPPQAPFLKSCSAVGESRDFCASMRRLSREVERPRAKGFLPCRPERGGAGNIHPGRMGLLRKGPFLLSLWGGEVRTSVGKRGFRQQKGTALGLSLFSWNVLSASSFPLKQRVFQVGHFYFAVFTQEDLIAAQAAAFRAENRGQDSGHAEQERAEILRSA